MFRCLTALRCLAAASALAAAAMVASATKPERFVLVPGTMDPGRQPDGNSVILDAPAGLIVFDTGRHPAQQEKILAIARSRSKPIAAIVNSHWHLDHSGGDGALRAAYPRAQLFASNAIQGALRGFFPKSRADAEKFMAFGKAGEAEVEDMKRDIGRIAAPAALMPTHPINRSARMRIAGRLLEVHLARFAATEGDVWIRDPREQVVLAGDLVVGIVPFFDTACPDGWRKALDEIARTPFVRLVPGHGEVMTRDDFLSWRRAFNNLLDCAASDRSRQACVSGWTADASSFIPAGRERLAANFVGYYLDSRLRAAPEERDRFCKAL
jgi:glyoxylase-like metal-dependent hydrolase (beta-lactamase superfamily II)